MAVDAWHEEVRLKNFSIFVGLVRLTSVQYLLESSACVHCFWTTRIGGGRDHCSGETYPL